MHNALSKLANNDKIFRLIILYVMVGYIFFIVFQTLKSILTPFFAGFIIAYICNKLMDFAAKKGISRGFFSAFLVSALIISLIFVLLVFLPLLEKELVVIFSKLPYVVQNSSKVLEPLLEKLTIHFPDLNASHLKAQLGHHMGDIFKWILQGIIGLISSGVILANMLSILILTPIITFYFLKDWPQLISIISCKINTRWREIFINIDDALSSYARGQIIVCCTLAALYSIALSLIGMEHAIIIGFITGFFSFIPYLGSFIGVIISLCVALGDFNSSFEYITLLSVFFVVAIIEGQFLTPRFIGKKIGLHPVWIIFSLLVGAVSFGFIGVVFALPVATIVSVLIRSFLGR